MQAVIAHNRSIAARAAQLNIRVGETRFPVMDRTALATWLANRLQGARRISEVSDMNALRLPELDAGLVTRTLFECPDTLNVLGTVVPVEYRAPYCGTPQVPRASLPEELVANNGWLNLPDVGIALPGGRVVEVSFRIGGSYNGTTFADTNIPVLKGKVKGHLNQKQWDGITGLPGIPLPDFSDDNAKIPEIVTHQYGTCAVEGVPLMSYGTLSVNSSRYYDTDPWFKVLYYQNLEEAQKARQAAVEKLSQVREETKLQAQRDGFLVEVETLKAQASKLYSLAYNQYYSEFDSGLRNEVSNLCNYYFYSSTSTAQIKQWIIQATPILDQAQAEVDRINTQRAEAERVRLEEEARRGQSGERLFEILNEHFHTCPFCNQPFGWQESDARYAAVNGGNLLPRCQCYNGLESVPVGRAIVDAICSGIQGQTVQVDRRYSATVLHRINIGEYPVVEVATYQYGGQWNLTPVVHADALVKEGEVTVVQVWHQPTELEVKLADARRMRDTYAQQVEDAEQEMGSSWSQVRKLSFRLGKNPRSGADQWETGNKDRKFVLSDRSAIQNIKAGVTYYCRDGKTIDLGRSQIVFVDAYLQIGRDIDAEIADIERQIEKVKNPQAVVVHPVVETLAKLEPIKVVQSKPAAPKLELGGLMAKFGH
ncbi:TPA: hypothetical protein DCW61_05000 [Candidatus Uhrbacteria bacterium]|nr:hypothetical protein [Candidatus Uhrbacteria bacterium]